MRAVAPVAVVRTVTREVAVLDAGGTTVVQLQWVEAALPVAARLEVAPVPGHRRDARAVVRALLAAGGFVRATGPLAAQLLAAVGAGYAEGTAAGPGGGDAEAAAPRPGTPGRVAVAAALLRFAAEVSATVEGTVEDVDTEFLHDLRVGVRRTRALLKQAGDVLPDGLAARYAPGFRWLGELTTPTRDLDVYLLELDELARALVAGQPADLEPFAAHLRRQRAAARRRLVRGLRSRRFETLMVGWQDALTAVIAAGSPPGRARAAAPLPPPLHVAGPAPSVERLAATRLERQARRVLRMARTITPGSPPEAVHALRKRCKELRYLLEAFGPLCEPSAHQAAVRDLRQLQDVLGAFQDGEVQSAGLRTFAQQMLDAGDPPAATLLAMGELAGHFAVHQRQARGALAGELHRYLRAGTVERIAVPLP